MTYNIRNQLFHFAYIFPAHRLIGPDGFQRRHPSHRLVRKNINGALDIRKKFNLNLLAVRDNGNPSKVVTGETVLLENQTILVLGRWKDVQKCFRI